MNWPFDHFAVSQLHLWQRDLCLWLISPEMLIHIIDIAKQEKQKLGLPSFIVEEGVDMSCNAQ